MVSSRYKHIRLRRQLKIELISLIVNPFSQVKITHVIFTGLTINAVNSKIYTHAQLLLFTAIYIYIYIVNMASMSGADNSRRSNMKRVFRGSQAEFAVWAASEEAKSVTVLDCAGNQISDLSPIAGLTGLAVLDCADNQISDLSPVSGLVGLSELWCAGNQITDLSPVSGLVGLYVHS